MLLMIEASRDDPDAALYSLQRVPVEDVLFPNGDTVIAAEPVPIAWTTDFEFDLASPPNVLITAVSIEIADAATGALLHSASELPHSGTYSGWTPSPLLAGVTAEVRLTFHTIIDHPPAQVVRHMTIENHPDAPLIEGLALSPAPGGEVTIEWTTDRPATGHVFASNDVDATTVDGTSPSGTAHSVTLTLPVSATWSLIVTATSGSHASMVAREWSTEFATSFANLSDATGLEIPAGSKPYSSVALDYDGDGAEDLLISFEDSPASLYRNLDRPDSEAPEFEERRGFDLHDGTVQNTFGLAAADFDGDGRVDVFIADADTLSPQHLLLAGSASGLDLDRSTLLGAVRTMPAIGASFGDLNGDGWLDLYVMAHRSGSGDVLLQSGSQAAAFTDVTAAAGLPTDRTHSTSAVWASLRVGEPPDLVVGWGKAVGANGQHSAYYVNTGPSPDPQAGGQFVFEDGVQSTPPRLPQIGHVRSIVVADVTGDRRLDLLFATAAPGASTNLEVFVNDGTGDFSPADQALGLMIESPLIDLAVTDLDGNGVPDVLALPDGGGEVVVLSGHGDHTDRVFRDRTSIVSLGADPATGLNVADFNGDADADVFLLRPQSAGGKQFYWANRLADAAGSSSSHRAFSVGFLPWTAVGNPNTMAIGATISVEVTAPGGKILRSSYVVDGGSRRASQSSGRPVFGLAGASTAQITVRWPHGQTQVFDAASAFGFPRVLLKDTSDPGILASSISATYVPSSGYAIHTYAWRSTQPGGTPQVLVTTSSKAPASCKLPLGGGTQLLLDSSVPGVTVTSVPIDGEWLHTVTWIAYCSADCTYAFFVRNVVGGEVYSSTQQTLYVSVCADIQE